MLSMETPTLSFKFSNQEEEKQEIEMPEKKLFTALIDRALRDAQGEVEQAEYKQCIVQREARDWLLNPSREYGSFLWWCDITDSPEGFEEDLIDFVKNGGEYEHDGTVYRRRTKEAQRRADWAVSQILKLPLPDSQE